MPNNEMNSNPVKQSSTFMGALQDKLKDINNFSNWSAKDQMVAVTAVGVVFGALLPVVAVALPVAATGAAVALTLFFAVKAVEYAFKGLKWSAEKAWKGAKHVGGKIRDGAVYVKDQLKSGTSHKVHNVSQLLDRLSSQTNYSEAMLNSQLISSDAKNKIVSIKEQFMNIFDNEKIANKDRLLEKILENIVLQIESKKDLAQGTDSMKYAGEWSKQINFINGLDAEKLHNLLTKQSSPKNTYFLYTIFSEHHSEIKEVIGERKTEHKLSNVVEELSDIARKHGRRVSSTQSTPPSLSRSSSVDTDGSTAGLVNPEEHKEVKAPTSFWNRFSSPFKSGKKPEQTSEIKYQPLSKLDGAMPPATVDPTRFRRNSSSGSYDGPPAPAPVDPPKAPESPTTSGYDSERSSPSSSGPSTPPKPLAVYLVKVNKQKEQRIPSSHSSSPDSGIDSPGLSGSSTPKGRQSPVNLDPFGSIGSTGLPEPLTPKKIDLSQHNLSEARRKLRKTDSHKPKQPSTHMSEQKPMPVKQRLETSV